jgi:hypothetical protein
MAVGSGISATLGIATETTPGTPVAVTRFTEFNSETMKMKKTAVQGQGLRGGALVRLQSRRNYVARQAAGDLAFDIPTSGFGLFLQHMLGSFSTTPTSLGGGLYQQIHNTGSLQGKAFTTQLVKPDTSGVLAPEAFTYPGCKITGWELTAQQNQQVGIKLTIDALDEATSGNSITATALAALSAAAATTISTVASIPAGTYITIGTGVTKEVRLTTAVSGAGPYTVTVPALAYGHASGSVVGSATGAAYGSAAALQAASYVTGTNMWDFSQGALVQGGSTSVVSGVWTMTGGTTVANVRSVSLKGSNPLKVDRFGLGSAIRSEQLENNFRDYTSTIAVDYNSRLFYDAYAADVSLGLYLKFTHPSGAILQVYCPASFIEDGASPQVGGPDTIIQSLPFTHEDDGTNGAIQFVYTSTDASV